MKAAVVQAPGTAPVYTDFPAPTAQPGQEVITVRAAALTNLTRGRASGTHYSADSRFPAVAGTDGVGLTADGRRIYFAQPVAPFGALAEKALIRSGISVPVPGELDDVTAAALANPGMSAWASIVERARLQPGETVLINGATGVAGRVAVQVAKYLGAARIVATGRNEAELEALKSLGADATIPLHLDTADGKNDFEAALREEFGRGIGVVIDYLWGDSARSLIVTIARAEEDARPVRFVQVGAAAGQDSIDLPATALRSSAIVLMGSGLKSVSMQTLLRCIEQVFALAAKQRLAIDVVTAPLAEVNERWNGPTNPRLVFTV